jgi:hypothetical protein
VVKVIMLDRLRHMVPVELVAQLRKAWRKVLQLADFLRLEWQIEPE